MVGGGGRGVRLRMPKGGLLLLRRRLAQVSIQFFNCRRNHNRVATASFHVSALSLTGKYTPLSLISKVAVSAHIHTGFKQPLLRVRMGELTTQFIFRRILQLKRLRSRYCCVLELVVACIALRLVGGFRCATEWVANRHCDRALSAEQDDMFSSWGVSELEERCCGREHKVDGRVGRARRCHY